MLNCFSSRKYIRRVILLFFLIAINCSLIAQVKDSSASTQKITADSTVQKVDTINLLYARAPKKSSGYVPLNYIQNQPDVSIQQMLKAKAAGVYVQESSGEPGKEQYMYIRGLNSPLLTKRDVYAQQPVVFINGIPLMQDNIMTFDIQPTDFNRVGSGLNLLAILDQQNIESIEVLKNAEDLAKLGPIAANGAIWITMKSPKHGLNELFFSSYVGVPTQSKITPVNAAYENAFRQPFYDKYGTASDRISYPTYLKDSANLNYYGPANWTDLYFDNKPFYSVSAGANVGHPKANVRLAVNHTTNTSGQDDGLMKRYGFSISNNLVPLSWLTFSTTINGSRLQKASNRNVRDRLAEARYIPDLSSPLSPNKSSYGQYLNIFNNVIDDNKVNSLQGSFSAKANFSGFTFITKLAVDYNESLRDVFWPTFLFSGNNFVSNYYGYNQRLYFHNSLNYAHAFGENHLVKFDVGQSFQSDLSKYDYGYGYNTPNNFIRVHPTYFDGGGNYQQDFNMYFIPFSDKMKLTVSSLYGKVGYSFKENLITIGLTVRRDGASNVQPDRRWITTPIVSASWDAKRALLAGKDIFSSLVLRLSHGVFGIPYNTDIFSKGPRYVNDISWPADPNIGSYIGMPAASRPYTQGWTGYGIGWQKSHKSNIGIDFGLMNDKIQASFDFYNTDNKNLILPVTVPRELGYTSAYKNGMTVNNRGIDATINIKVIERPSSFSWSSNLNLNFNQNKLTALPDGLNEIVIGNQLLKVGKPIDAFWVYQNEGIYNSISEIPINSGGARQTFNGLSINPGDPKWKDVDGNNNIDNNDKLLMGHSLPVVTGGFGNDLSYKKFSFNFLFFFAAGQKLIDQQTANKLDFINNEGNKNLSTIKEIYFWQKTFNPSDYPLYNPWSNIIPFRQDQDLFLKDASFLKLRSVTLEYDAFGGKKKKQKSINKMVLYVSATNVFTVTEFKNGDPELIDYRGNYTGYSQNLSRMYVAGIRMSF